MLTFFIISSLVVLIISLILAIFSTAISVIRLLAEPEINDKQQILRKIKNNKPLLDAEISVLLRKSDIKKAWLSIPQYLIYHLCFSNCLRKIKCSLYSICFFTEYTVMIMAQSYLMLFRLIFLLITALKALVTKTRVQDIKLSAFANNTIKGIQPRYDKHLANMRKSLQNMTLL